MKARYPLLFFAILLLSGCAGRSSRPHRFIGPEVRLEYKPKESGRRVVYLAGNFNNWVIFDPNFRMRWDSIRKVFFIRISLQPGRYLYKFIVDGEWIVDPAAGAVVADKLGGRMGVFLVGQ